MRFARLCRQMVSQHCDQNLVPMLSPLPLFVTPNGPTMRRLQPLLRQRQKPRRVILLPGCRAPYSTLGYV